jgi:putative nucleotidyltransferase with HDIG domain
MQDIYKKIKSIFQMPFDPSDEDTNKVNIINTLINMAIVIMVSYIIFAFMMKGVFVSQFIIVIIMIFSWLGLRFSIKRGYENIVAIVLHSLTWLVVVYIFSFLENGLRAPAYNAALIFLIVHAGILLGPRAALITLGISIFVNTLLAIGETQGYYLTEPKIPDIRWVLIGQIIFFSAITFMLNKTLGNFKKSIVLYRNEAEERLHAEQDVKRLNRELEEAYETTISGWAQALDLRDKETEGHSRRVTELTIELARHMGVDESDIKFVRYGALLHDIGKMGIPDEILKKPGRLTKKERLIVEQHPAIAVQLLKDIQYLHKAMPIPYAHHEHWDGTGYPQGLQGEEIPLPARIFTVVDHWDALTSDRFYRRAWPQGKVVKYMREKSGEIFDPHVADVFLKRVVRVI